MCSTLIQSQIKWMHLVRGLFKDYVTILRGRYGARSGIIGAFIASLG